jgi:hypothetical protein
MLYLLEPRQDDHLLQIMLCELNPFSRQRSYGYQSLDTQQSPREPVLVKLVLASILHKIQMQP